MLVFAKAGDALWLGAPFDPRRLGPLLRDRGCELIFGDLVGQTLSDAVFPWAWTADVAGALEVPPPCSIAMIAELNDRRFSLALEASLGVGISGCLVAYDKAVMGDALERWPHPQPWVLKAPLSASGRSRLRRHGPPERDALTRAGRLLDRFGCLILEPWLDRDNDYGTVGWIDDAGIKLEATHRLVVDGNGVFRAIILGARAPKLIANAAADVATELSRRGYRGPFGVDSFTYHNANGIHVRPVCEINVRLSFGHLAHAVAENLGDALGLGAQDALELGIARAGGVPDDATILVNATADDPTTVYARCHSNASSA